MLYENLNFSLKISMITLCNTQLLYYIIHVIWKYSDSSENVSSSFFDYILNIFICLLLYLSLFQKNLQYYQLTYVILQFIIQMFYENLVLSENISTSFFIYILIAFVCLSFHLSFSNNFLYYQLSYVILNFITHRLDENMQYYPKISWLPFSIIF